VCARPILFEEEGLTETLCAHVMAVVDWVEILTLSDELGEKSGERLEEAFELDNDKDRLQNLADALPSTALVLEFIEPARGGGHDRSSIAFAVDFAH
jgi:hypothetical protein